MRNRKSPPAGTPANNRGVDEAIKMKATDSKLRDGAQCKVVAGTHAGKSGTVRDIKTGKTGYVSLTVVQPNGERFKTLAKNVIL